MKYFQPQALQEIRAYIERSTHPLDIFNGELAEFAALANDRIFIDLYEQIGDSTYVMCCDWRSIHEAMKVGYLGVANGYDSISFYQGQIEMDVVEVITPSCGHWNEARIAKLPNGRYAFSYSFGTNKGCNSCGFRLGKGNTYKTIEAAKEAISYKACKYFEKRKDCKEYKAWIRVLSQPNRKIVNEQLNLF